MNHLLKHTKIMSDNFFEGAEKLLEIWFTTSDKTSSTGASSNDLRKIPR